MAKRNYTRYTMRDGNEIVKYGITTDPERREGENVRAGLGDTLRTEGSKVTEGTARDWGSAKIEQVRAA